MYTYLVILLFTVSIPLALSFERRRVHYAGKWRYLFPALVLSAAVFVPWDAYYTRMGMWGFTPAYLTGIRAFGLPVEEVFFFFAVPFSCVFIYEVLRYLRPVQPLQKAARLLTAFLCGACLLIGVLNPGKIYTVSIACAAVFVFALHLFIFKADYLGYFYAAYLASLIPMLLVNGIMTSGLRAIDDGPLVWYNERHITGWRVLSIPIEDILYWSLLFLVVITWYEFFKRKFSRA